MAKKLWEWFAYPDPAIELIDELKDCLAGRPGAAVVAVCSNSAQMGPFQEHPYVLALLAGDEAKAHEIIFEADTPAGKAFDVALHFGTFVAVVLYFRDDLVRYVREGVRLIWNRERPIDPDGRIAWLLVVATIPAASPNFSGLTATVAAMARTGKALVSTDTMLKRVRIFDAMDRSLEEGREIEVG